jgi:serine/threonine protein kinase
MLQEYAAKVVGDTDEHRREIKTVESLCKGEGDQWPHPHVIRAWFTSIFQSSALDTGKVVILMDLCDGTLDGMLLDRKAKRSHLSAFEIFTIAIQVLEGLKYCHSRGYTHRDLNPRNGMHPATS